MKYQGDENVDTEGKVAGTRKCNLTNFGRMDLPIQINRMRPLSVLGNSSVIFKFYSKFRENFSMQTE